MGLELQIADLDGNVLRLASEPRVGMVTGEWLDMHGVRWAAGQLRQLAARRLGTQKQLCKYL